VVEAVATPHDLVSFHALRCPSKSVITHVDQAMKPQTLPVIAGITVIG
jgi:hypothetical protein